MHQEEEEKKGETYSLFSPSIFNGFVIGATTGWVAPPSVPSPPPRRSGDKERRKWKEFADEVQCLTMSSRKKKTSGRLSIANPEILGSAFAVSMPSYTG